MSTTLRKPRSKAAMIAAILGSIGINFGQLERAIPPAPANYHESYVAGRRSRRGKGKFNKPASWRPSRNGINVVEARSRNGVGRPPDHKRKIA